MKNYLKIQSNGEIEIEAFTLIGASSKRGDSQKIGYYGSGLKYSIASMLRNRINFFVFQGTTEIKFQSRQKTFRNEIHDQIYVNDQPTSLTVGMGGKDWDLPFAPIREIYSNALDEDADAAIEKTNEIMGQIGKTTIYIEMNENVAHFYDNMFLYFCNNNPAVLHSNKNGSIYPGGDQEVRLFRKGILSYQSATESMYWYNSHSFDINESRVINGLYAAKQKVAELWQVCEDKDMILNFLTGLSQGSDKVFEWDISWSTWESFSEVWGEVCRELKFVPHALITYLDDMNEIKGRLIMPTGLLKALQSQFKDLDILGLTSSDKTSFIATEIVSSILTDKVVEAISLLQKTRYKYRLIDPLIKYGKFTDNETLAQAENGEILLSTKLDTYEIGEIAKIIIEENEHNKTGYGDKTRNFQNHLFSLYYDEMISKVLVNA